MPPELAVPHWARSMVSHSSDPKSLMVMVPGVQKWQSLENFHWGQGPLAIPE